MASDRLPWETAGGPQVGREVEITSEPRRGEPRRGGPRRGEPRPQATPARPEPTPPPRAEEVREVRAQDPALTAEANARLTAELRDVVGADRVRTAGAPARTRRPGVLDYVSEYRLHVIGSLVVMLTFGAVVALASGAWWVLPVAVAFHALATTTVMVAVIRMTTVIEHPSPELAATLVEEGVSSPDEYFSQLVREFGGAGAAQSAEITPTGAPSRPHRGSGPRAVIWTTWVALLALSIVLPALTGGGWMWVLPAIMVPLLAGWAAVNRRLGRSANGYSRASRRRPAGTAP